MRQILHMLETSRKLIKWVIEISEFDIKYEPRTTVKGYVLADFIVEFTPTNTPTQPTKTTQLAPDLPFWRLFVDRATNSQGSGAGLILTSSNRIDVEYALRFGFQASNNEAEYEYVITGPNLTHSMEADQLEICSDS